VLKKAESSLGFDASRGLSRRPPTVNGTTKPNTNSAEASLKGEAHEVPPPQSLTEVPEEEERRSSLLSDHSLAGSIHEYAPESHKESEKSLEVPARALELRESWVQILESDEMALGLPTTAPSTHTSHRMRRPQTGARSFFLGVQDVHWLSLSRFVSSPASPFRQTWDFSGLFLLAVDLIVTPLQLFELPETMLFGLLRLVSAAFWTMDIIASFLVGYHHNGEVEMSPKKIASNYIRSWFALDVSLASIDWIIIFMGQDSRASSALRLGKVSRFMRAVRLLRLVKMRNMLEEVQGVLRSEFKRTVFYISKLISIIVCLNHFVACGFYGLSAWKPQNELSWIEVSFQDEHNLAYRYSTSLHWSLTQFTPASMEVVPVNAVERFYTVCVLLMALVTFSSFISSITTAMTHLREINEQKLSKESKLRRYLDEHLISKHLRARVLHYIQERSMLQQRQALVKENEVELFKVLPDSMKNDLRYEAWLPTLMKHPFMFQWHAVDEQAVNHLCRVAISERRLIVREELYGHSKPVTHMPFVVQGVLGYSFFHAGAFVSRHIKEGQWCAECCLWSDSEWSFEACLPFVAETNAELMLVSAEELASLVPKYPASAYAVACYGVYYLQAASHECLNGSENQVMIFGSEQDQLQEIAHSAFEEGLHRDESADRDSEELTKEKWSFGAFFETLQNPGRSGSKEASDRTSRRSEGDSDRPRWSQRSSKKGSEGGSETLNGNQSNNLGVPMSNTSSKASNQDSDMSASNGINSSGTRD